MNRVVLDPRTNDASLFLDATRAIASQAVAIGHAASLYQQVPWLILPGTPPIQDVAVCVFFALSGFLIAQTIQSHQAASAYRFRAFALDRFARIYSAYFPCLLLIAVLDWITLSRSPEYPYAGATGILPFLANLAMLQDVPSQHRAIWTSYGSARPLWTLAIEWWIYMFVGAAVLWRHADWWRIPLFVVLAVVPAVNLLGGRGSGLFLLWLLGAGALWIVRLDAFARVPSWALFGTAILGVAAYVSQIGSAGQVYDLRAHALLGLTFTVSVGLALRSRLTVDAFRVTRVIRFVSGYSLTLYIVHYSVMEALKHLVPADPATQWWQALLLANLVAIVVASQTERKYRTLARGARSLLASSLRGDATSGGPGASLQRS